MEITLAVLTPVDPLELLFLSLQAAVYLGHRSNSPRFVDSTTEAEYKTLSEGGKEAV